MNALRNPVVVLALVAVALGIVIYNVTSSGRRSVPRAVAGTPSAAAAASSAAAVSRSNAAPAIPTSARPTSVNATNTRPTRPMDQDYIVAHFGEWLESPRRDPFEVYMHPRSGGGARTHVPTAAEVLTLTAIWRQTGSRLAVINGMIVGEGQVIQGFQVERVEGNMVWVRGTQGRERLEFRPLGSQGAANQAGAQPLTPRY
jgi:hypothetical protein